MIGYFLFPRGLIIARILPTIFENSLQLHLVLYGLNFFVPLPKMFLKTNQPKNFNYRSSPPNHSSSVCILVDGALFLFFFHRMKHRIMIWTTYTVIQSSQQATRVTKKAHIKNGYYAKLCQNWGVQLQTLPTHPLLAKRLIYFRFCLNRW